MSTPEDSEIYACFVTQSQSQGRAWSYVGFLPAALVLEFGALVAFLMRDYGLSSLIGVVFGFLAFRLAVRARSARKR